MSSFKAMREAARKAQGAPVVLSQYVSVNQKESALVLAHRNDIKYIATTGLGPCVGVLVVGAVGVGLAHIDSDSVGNAKVLALYAKGTIANPTKVYIASGTPMPQPGKGGDRSTTEIYAQIKEVFPEAETVNSSEIAWSLETQTLVTKFSLDGKSAIDNVSHWKLSPFAPDKPF